MTESCACTFLLTLIFKSWKLNWTENGLTKAWNNIDSKLALLPTLWPFNMYFVYAPQKTAFGFVIIWPFSKWIKYMLVKKVFTVHIIWININNMRLLANEQIKREEDSQHIASNGYINLFRLICVQIQMQQNGMKNVFRERKTNYISMFWK